MESSHNYVDNGECSGSVEFDIAESLEVKFDEQCSTEDGADWLKLFKSRQDLDNDSNQLGYYTGANMRTKQLAVTGNKVFYKWHSGQFATSMWQGIVLHCDTEYRVWCYQ